MIAFARGALDRAAQDPDPCAGEDRVEGSGELRVPIAEQEPDRGDLLVEIHEQVAGHLGDPGIVGMIGDAEDPDAAGGVFDDREHVGAGAVEEVNGEEVGSEDRLRLTVQELRPRRPGAPGCGWQSSLGQDLPDRRRRHDDAEAREFAVDAPVAPAGVLFGIV
jgi:hypothetical protein